MSQSVSDPATEALDEQVSHVPPVSQTLTRTLIRPRSGWQWINLRELWQYRELMFSLAARDVKVRYKQTVLGACWAIIQPVLMMLIFSAVFGRNEKASGDGLPYPIFFYSGFLLWYFFSNAITAAGNSLVRSQDMITKIYFPRLAVPFSAIGAAAVDFLVAVSVLVALMVYYQVALTWQIMLVPLLLILTSLAALGVGTFLAAMNVSYRDFRYTLPFLVQLWMFATPVIFIREAPDPPVAKASGAVAQPAKTSSEAMPEAAAAGRTVQSDSSAASKASKIPATIRRWLDYNPMMGLVASFRAAMLGRPIPWGSLGYASAVTLAAFVFGCAFFRRVESTFADVI